MKRRTGALWGGAAAVVAALASHAVYWYGPTERGGAPSPSARALLVDPAWEHAVWIAYPHQNLGALERRVGDIRSWIGLLRDGQGESAAALPRFGPFAVPPATELVVAERAHGTELRARVRVYPVVGVLARAAGRLARNPWLAGGGIRLSGGRTGQVAWRDGVWELEAGAAGGEGPGRVEATRAEREARALVRLGRPLGRLPPGTYRLVRGERGLELRSGPPVRFEPTALGGEPAPMAWLLESSGRRQAAGLLLWSEPGALPPFPAAATLQKGRASMRLPGEELLRIAGREPVRLRGGGFEVRALGRPEAELAVASATELGALLTLHPDLRLVAGADLDRLRSTAERIAERFRGLPVARLAGLDSERLARVLAAAEGCGVSRLELRARPDRLRWLLCPGPEAAPPV